MAAAAPRSTVVQVTNVSPTATSEQLRTLFGHIGVLEEFVMYPGDDKEEAASRVAFVRYREPINAEVALHLNNTVFLDRALIVLPLANGLDSIPDEKYANLVRAPANTAAGVLPRTADWPLDVISMVVGRPGEQVIHTIEPRLTTLAFPLYPPLAATTDGSRIEEIRRTILVTNLDPKTSGDQVLEFFNKHAEVRCVRMAGTEFDRAAYVEFTQQPSIVKAFGLMGATLNGRQIMVQHSNCAIIKPANNFAMFDDGSKIAAAIESKSEHRRYKDRSRSRSRDRRSRSRRRSTSRRRHSRSRDRRRSHSRHSKRRSRTRSRSHGRRRHSRSISRDRRRSNRGRSRSRERRRYRRSRSRSERHRSPRSRSRGRRTDRYDRDRDRDRGFYRGGRDRHREKDRHDRDYDKDRRRDKDRDHRRDSKSRRHRDDSEKRTHDSGRYERRRTEEPCSTAPCGGETFRGTVSERGNSISKRVRRASSGTSYASDSRSDNGSNARHPSYKESPRHSSNRESLRHTSDRESPRHTSDRDSLRHASDRESPRHISDGESLRHVPGRESPRHYPEGESLRHAPGRESPRHYPEGESPRHAPGRESPRHYSEGESLRHAPDRESPRHASDRESPLHNGKSNLDDSPPRSFMSETDFRTFDHGYPSDVEAPNYLSPNNTSEANPALDPPNDSDSSSDAMDTEV